MFLVSTLANRQNWVKTLKLTGIFAISFFFHKNQKPFHFQIPPKNILFCIGYERISPLHRLFFLTKPIMNPDYRPLALNLVFLKVDFLKCNIRYLVTVERRPSSQKICLLLQQHYVGQQNKTFPNFPKLWPTIIQFESSCNKKNLVDGKESDRGDYCAHCP